MSVLHSPKSFACEVHPDRERVVVFLSGELDLATTPRAWDALGELLEAGFSKVTVDLSALSFLDSTGLRLLLTTARAAREYDCELTLVPGPEHVQRLFALTELESEFSFESGFGVARTRSVRRFPAGGPVRPTVEA